MPYRPVLNSRIAILEREYLFTEHPSAPGIPYGQTGRRATVYQLADSSGRLFALKIFTKAFRNPQNEKNVDRLSEFAGIPGLQVCSRLVLSHENSSSLIGAHPELEYAVFMPWISGHTWQETMLQRQTLEAFECHARSMYLASTLTTMEQHHLAHCDLSAANLLLTSAGVSLVDVEDMYVPDLPRPAQLPTGSMGYGHRAASGGLWSEHADRFAGPVLLAEILCWCNPQIVQAAYGEQYYAPEELQTDSDRFNLMFDTLKSYECTTLLDLFRETWMSQSLEDCPPIAEWYAVLQSKVTPPNRYPASLPRFKVDYPSTVILQPVTAKPVVFNPARPPRAPISAPRAKNQGLRALAWFLLFVGALLVAAAGLLLAADILSAFLGY